MKPVFFIWREREGVGCLHSADFYLSKVAAAKAADELRAELQKAVDEGRFGNASFIEYSVVEGRLHE